jgi:serine/threonine protein kinase
MPNDCHVLVVHRIKIFDFGLAKELEEKKKNADGTFNLTGHTGSPRYMAPEVSKAEPYNLSCDAVSQYWSGARLVR